MPNPTSHRLKDDKGLDCPKCMHNLDGATGMDTLEVRPPEAGDLSVCVYCCTPLEYVAVPGTTGALTFKTLDISALEPDIRKEMDNAIRIAKTFSFHRKASGEET